MTSKPKRSRRRDTARRRQRRLGLLFEALEVRQLLAVDVNSPAEVAGAVGDQNYIVSGAWDGAVIKEVKGQGRDTLDLSGVNEDLTIHIQKGSVVTVSNNAAKAADRKTLIAENVEILKGGGRKTVFIVDKDAEITNGEIIGSSAAGASTTVSFTQNVANPSALTLPSFGSSAAKSVPRKVVVDLGNNGNCRQCGEGR